MNISVEFKSDPGYYHEFPLAEVTVEFEGHTHVWECRLHGVPDNMSFFGPSDDDDDAPWIDWKSTEQQAIAEVRKQLFSTERPSFWEIQEFHIPYTDHFFSDFKVYCEWSDSSLEQIIWPLNKNKALNRSCYDSIPF